MNPDNSEIEAKFFLRDLSKVAARLRELNARLVQPRAHETNLRFDTPKLDLRKEGRVLRLRQDDKVRMTYKEAGNLEDGVLSRTEIEFVVDDYQKAKQFLEALGYEKQVFYEKLRTTYDLNDTHVMLDELPYGNFVEIEGRSVEEIQATAQILGLKWTPVTISYLALFERFCERPKFKLTDLSFENFKGVTVTEEDLGVTAADI
jgi:adenylate cyclase, class 2